MLLFLLGRELASAGDFSRARELLVAAKDLDPIPWRVVSRFNEVVSSWSDSPGVNLADTEAAMQREAENGLVGLSLVADNCHPTPLGSSVIAGTIVSAMAREGIFLAKQPIPWNADDQLPRYLDVSLEAELRQFLELEYLLKNGKYAMKTPFFNYSLPRMYLDQARVHSSPDWRVWANLATLSLLAGDIAAGREELREAAALRVEPLDAGDRGQVPYLSEALRETGLTLEELLASTDPV